MKSKNLFKWHNGVGIVVIIALLIIIVGGIGFLFLKNRPSYIPPNSKAASDQNIELMSKASEFRDTRYCDQIKGSINYTNPNGEKLPGGLTAGVSRVTPAMTETQAKNKCRDDVQGLIDQKNYESKVCADKNVTLYKFNGVTWPCPERN